MMKHAAALLLSLSALLAGVAPVGAELPELTSDRPIRGVIELFTSQGCSSCPPADALIKTYADNRDVIALTFPVDYWDYLGWRDTLANPRNTERQREYARQRGDGDVYTPQMIINGTKHVVGSDRSEIDKAIESLWPRFSTNRVPVRFWLQGGAVIVETGASRDATTAKEATIWFAIVQRKVEVPITRGENKGQTITYTNVVREMSPIGMWDGKPKSIRISRNAIIRPDVEACAILVQQGEGGPIVGAAWMGL